MSEKCRYPDLGRDSDWSNREGNLLPPIISTTQICHQYGYLQSFLRRHFSRGETSGGVPKCQVFALARAMYGIYFFSLKIFHLHFFA